MEGSSTRARSKTLVLVLLAGLLTAAAGCADTAGPERLIVDSIELSVGNATLLRGEAITVAAVARAADGRAVSDVEIEWQSSNPAVATVSMAGSVVAGNLGTATISATADGRRADLEIGVLPAAVADLEGSWRMRSFDGQLVPAPYVILLDEPVGDSIVARVEIRLDSATMQQSAGTYQRLYCFTELHNHIVAFKYCWGDHGIATIGVAGAQRGRIRLQSEYIQNLEAEGEVRTDVTLALTEPLWVQEPPRATVWVRN